MPELAEVAYYARQWDAAAGQKILKVHTGTKARFFRHSPAPAFAALKGTAYRGAQSRGKNLLFQFSRGFYVTGHLGMSGELLLEAAEHVPTKHDHLVLYTKTAALVFRDFRMFGAVRLEQTRGGPPDSWTSLPPEILEAGFTIARVSEALRRFAKTPLKALLLDQEWFPGIGNWMADEVCYQMKLHPATPAGSLDPQALRKVLRAICRVSLRTIGRDWSDPPETWLMRHRWKAGGHCPDPGCGTPLVRRTLRGRTACWCPRCQRGPE